MLIWKKTFKFYILYKQTRAAHILYKTGNNFNEFRVKSLFYQAFLRISILFGAKLVYIQKL